MGGAGVGHPVRIGITEYAQSKLGTSFCAAPRCGSETESGEPFGRSSRRRASDLYAPLTGKGRGGQHRARGLARAGQPDPYGEADIVREISDADDPRGSSSRPGLDGYAKITES